MLLKVRFVSRSLFQVNIIIRCIKIDKKVDPYFTEAKNEEVVTLGLKGDATLSYDKISDIITFAHYSISLYNKPVEV